MDDPSVQSTLLSIEFDQIPIENLQMEQKSIKTLKIYDSLFWNSLKYKKGGKLSIIAYCAIVAIVTKYWNIGQRNCFVLRRTPQIMHNQMMYTNDTVSLRKLINVTNAMSVNSMPNL